MIFLVSDPAKAESMLTDMLEHGVKFTTQVATSDFVVTKMIARLVAGQVNGDFKMDANMASIRHKDNVAYFRPIGDGSELRGLRKNVLLVTNGVADSVIERICNSERVPATTGEQA